MTKTELVKKVSDLTDLDQTIVNTVVTTLFDEITNSLQNGERVQIVGFGAFNCKRREERRIRKVNSGEIVTIPEHYAPVFEASSTLKAAVK